MSPLLHGSPSPTLTKLYRALLDPAVTTAFVGAEQRKFSIHKALLLQHSEYFRSAYNSQMKEALEDTFVFNDIDSNVFQTFILWLYTNEILLGAGLLSLGDLRGAEGEAEEDDESTTSCGADHRNDSTLSEGWYEDLGDEEEGGEEAAENFGEDMIFESLTDEEWFHAIHDPDHHFAGDPEQLSSYQLRTLLMLQEKNVSYDAERIQWKALLAEKASAGDDEEAIITTALIDLYILADRFGVRELRVTTMDRLQEQCSDPSGNVVPFELVSRAFDNLPPSSPLRTWLVQVFASNWNPRDDDAERAESRRNLAKDFLLEVLAATASRINEQEVDMCYFDMCYFHEHETWEELKVCR